MIAPALDRLSRGDSWLHRTLPEAKLIAFTAISAAAASEREFVWQRLAVYTVALGYLILASGTPPSYVLRRVLLVVGPLSIAALLGWWTRVLDPRAILARGVIAAAALTLLAATTRAADLLGALERLKAPQVVVLLLSGLFRFVPLLQGEWQTMTAARLSRTPGKPRRMEALTFARQIANLFIRSWHRAERTQAAMFSRCFSGRFHQHGRRPWRLADLLFAAVCLGIAIGIRWSHVF